jgi:hypothetical protein
MHMAKSKRGRPAWQPTAKERETVKAMTSYGISQDAICAVLKVTRATLEKHCRHELDELLNLAAGACQHLFAVQLESLQAVLLERVNPGKPGKGR